MRCRAQRLRYTSEFTLSLLKHAVSHAKANPKEFIAVRQTHSCLLLETLLRCVSFQFLLVLLSFPNPTAAQDRCKEPSVCGCKSYAPGACTGWKLLDWVFGCFQNMLQ